MYIDWFYIFREDNEEAVESVMAELCNEVILGLG